MPHKPAKLLEDIFLAIEDLESFCAGKSFAVFEKDRQLQVAVERELEIIGEAFVRLKKVDVLLYARIEDADKIIGLRNILAHGYDILDHGILWDVVSTKMLPLKQTVEALQAEA